MTQDRDDDELQDSAPTLIREPAPAVTAISMKPPGQGDPAPTPAPPVLPKREVKLRAISEVGVKLAPPGGFGRLAPPRDSERARARQWPRAVLAAVAVIGIAAAVTMAIWWIAAWTG